MKGFICFFTGGMFFAEAAFGASLLKPQSFPKTFQDVPFETRLEILREGYLPYRIEYDESGNCISNCAYSGLTIQDDMNSVDEATNEIAELIQNSENNSGAQPTQPVQPTQPTQPTQPVQPTQPTQPVQPTQPTQPAPPSHSGGNNNTGAVDWCHNGKSTKLPLRYPVDMSGFKYKISSDFGFRTNSANGASFHPALDIACPSGTPVYATADGVVVTVANETRPGGAGNYINIKHDNGLITQYLHLNSVMVSKGDKVSACQQIAISGNTGTSTSGKTYPAHLDYRIRFDSDRNKYVDILCPCKTSNRKSQNSYDTNLNMSCAHSLFNATYKFKAGAKHPKWRVEHGHCMQDMNSLLPDEVAQ